VDFLVTMTTQVPAGTSEAAVQDIRTQEAARARELAAQRHLLRLWRPPLQPGEWRTLGLFAATDADQLEQILASMPLRVWRTDEVTPLSPHPNDPAGRTEPAPGTGDREFLITFTVAVPADTPGQDAGDAEAREARRARELAEQGHLLRLWKLPGDGRALGLWQAPDTGAMEAILASLPLTPWMSTQATPLTPHPSDPGAGHERSTGDSTSS
jgi:muconolactone delta-isomerase